jgi:hypothetical protein
MVVGGHAAFPGTKSVPLPAGGSYYETLNSEDYSSDTICETHDATFTLVTPGNFFNYNATATVGSPWDVCWNTGFSGFEFWDSTFARDGGVQCNGQIRVPVGALNSASSVGTGPAGTTGPKPPPAP